MTLPCDLLRGARERTDRTQEDVAGELKLTQACISKWESGESLPKPGDTPRIAEVYGIPHRRLLNAVLAALEARAKAKAAS